MKILGNKEKDKAFYLLFSIEMWERFGFYGMQALLVIFMVKYLKMNDALADNTFSAFSALLYTFILFGGYIGDKVLGLKRTMLLGGILLASGYFFIAFFIEKYLFLALGIIIAGNAMFKANPSALVSKLYEHGSAKLDSAFTIYYMSINLGGFLSTIISPWVKEHFGWKPAFLISFFGMTIAITNYLFFRKKLEKYGSDPDFKKLNWVKFFYVIILTIIIIFLSAWLLKNLIITHILLFSALICGLIIFIKEISASDSNETKMKMIACLILCTEALLFFVLYQQMPTSLTLFAMRNTNHEIFGINIPPESFQALNPFWIMIGSPIIAWIYDKLNSKGKDLSLPEKFTLGMFLCSLGFLTLTFVIKYFSKNKGIISGDWLVLTYGFQSFGELLISGLGLSMIARLVPGKKAAFMMGLWFVFQATGNVLGGYVASFASIPSNITNPIESIEIYKTLFFKLGCSTLIITGLMYLLVPYLKKSIGTT